MWWEDFGLIVSSEAEQKEFEEEWETLSGGEKGVLYAWGLSKFLQ